MKKNAMLKIAAILMVAVLLTTCAISSTFAKYAETPAEGNTNKGVVAKWGLEIAAAKDVALFATGYDDALSASADGSFIMAPGTANEADLGFTIKGAPEVAFKVVVDADVTLEGWMIDGSTFYCPVVFKVNDGTAITLSSADDVADLEEAIANAILEGTDVTVKPDGDAFYAEYEPNYDGFAGEGKSVEVSWEWAFSTGAENDAKDTKLGDLGHANSVTIAYSIKAEQIAKITA